jgi:hypothetical protein
MSLHCVRSLYVLLPQAGGHGSALGDQRLQKNEFELDCFKILDQKAALEQTRRLPRAF